MACTRHRNHPSLEEHSHDLAGVPGFHSLHHPRCTGRTDRAVALSTAFRLAYRRHFRSGRVAPVGLDLDGDGRNTLSKRLMWDGDGLATQPPGPVV